ncbi:MAG: prolyl-tRNA synthetase associated domain-containing protein [Lachnospiraceae bacterium]|nr:prolyl-tRNA synthetase associated domain-containing protein [Lachnospiraceae bacterium]
MDSELTLYHGRPADETGRLSKELRVYDLLDSLAIPFDRLDHEPMAHISDCEKVDRYLGTRICKNLFLCDAKHSSYYLLLMPGDKKFRTAVVSKLIAAPRLSFAEPEYMEQFLDVTPGSATVMALMNDPDCKVTLLIDKEVADCPYFACHPCINTSSIRFATSDLFEKLLPAMHHKATLLEI